jgi:hypothetical protein
MSLIYLRSILLSLPLGRLRYIKALLYLKAESPDQSYQREAILREPWIGRSLSQYCEQSNDELNSWSDRHNYLFSGKSVTRWTVTVSLLIVLNTKHVRAIAWNVNIATGPFNKQRRLLSLISICLQKGTSQAYELTDTPGMFGYGAAIKGALQSPSCLAGGSSNCIASLETALSTSL